MNRYHIIIPSAKVVPPELQKLGKLPAIIYPVNKEVVLDYLLEIYKDNASSFEIIIYENAEIVERRICDYSNNEINCWKLDHLEDIGYTVYFALKQNKELRKTPFIINFADTIVMDDITLCPKDAFYYSEDLISSMWTFFEEDNGVICSITDKNSDNEVSQKTGKLFTGVFKIEHSEDFYLCLKDTIEKNRHSSIDSFYAALLKYNQSHPLYGIKALEWFDIGHADKYFNSQLSVRARQFNHISIDKNRGILKKTSDEKDKFLGEILWYLKLPADIEYVRPRIFSYSTSWSEPYIEMEYYSYYTVHELFLYGDLSCRQWEDIFHKIRFLYNDFSRYKVVGTGILCAMEEMYKTKTIQRLSLLRNNKNFLPFFSESFTVNGIKYQPLNEIINQLIFAIDNMLSNKNEFQIIHGDLCFSNILVDSNFTFIKVIDPRGKFGKYDIYGDSRYELAKLFHSLDGKYDFIIKDLFRIQYCLETRTIDYTITDRKQEFDIYELFLRCLKSEIGNEKKSIELIEALLFLSMIPLHEESLNHQYAMLATGIQILNRIIDITMPIKT